MPRIELPRLVGSREAANEIVSRLEDVTDMTVIIDCRGLVSGSPSFADQLVVRLLAEKHAANLEVVDPDDDFWGYLKESADEIGFGDHIHRSEEHTSELQSRQYLVCRLLLEKKKKNIKNTK